MMAIEVTALIRKETKVDPSRPNDKAYYASLSLLNAEGKEYGPPRFLSEFRMRSTALRRRRLASSTFLRICPLSSRKLWASFKMVLIGVYPHDSFTWRRACYKAMS